MKSALVIVLLVFLLPIGSSAADQHAVLLIPRLPSPEFVPQVAFGVPTTSEEVRRSIASFMPPGVVLVQDVAIPASGLPVEDTALNRGEPHPVAVSLGMHPIIDLADSHYAPLRHDYIPVLLDWFEALAAGFDTTPAQMRVLGYRSNKVARLMRVFTEIRMHRDHGRDPGMAPAIGWCRILLQEDWGHYRKGETHSFVLINSERGWFVLDPFTRRIRQLQTNDPRWFVEFVVL